MKYEATITSVGSLARAFLPKNSSVILMDQGKRHKLAEMVVQHSVSKLVEDIEVGDTLLIGNDSYAITSVGADVNANMKSEGHCTLIINGTGSMPGQLILEGDNLPRLAAGEKIIIK